MSLVDENIRGFVPPDLDGWVCVNADSRNSIRWTGHPLDWPHLLEGRGRASRHEHRGERCSFLCAKESPFRSETNGDEGLTLDAKP